MADDGRCPRCAGLLVRELLTTVQRAKALSPADQQRRWFRRTDDPVETIQYDLLSARCVNCGGVVFA